MWPGLLATVAIKVLSAFSSFATHYQQDRACRLQAGMTAQDKSLLHDLIAVMLHEQEQVAPVVDPSLRQQIEDMGFSANKCAASHLHCNRNSSFIGFLKTHALVASQ